MTVNKISKSIKEIIDAFIRFNFRPLTYKSISEFLNKDANTIVQRINRNPNYFQVEGERPKKITLKEGLEEVYFYRDNNQCQICQKKLSPENLIIRPKDPHMKDKFPHLKHLMNKSGG